MDAVRDYRPYGPDGAALRPKVRPAHLENLRPLVIRRQSEDRRPFTDGSGSYHCRDGSEAEAVAFAKAILRDHGVFATSRSSRSQCFLMLLR